MNKIVLSFLALLCCINIQAGVKLQKQGSATQLVVNDKPMLLLTGELSNSAATSPADIRKALKQMKNSGVNSVFVPAYWEFVEPNEGKYDFALVDSVITTARKHDLKIVFLWFGAWKNSMSCYAPLWVKETPSVSHVHSQRTVSLWRYAQPSAITCFKQTNEHSAN